ncbi:hypothetical protein BJ742DRAFT_743478 [Cladochytrium replicatum]|nr:hypothetical protein BJ742DRAFT_743478 [Cladochytrium replicatum]
MNPFVLRAATTTSLMRELDTIAVMQATRHPGPANGYDFGETDILPILKKATLDAMMLYAFDLDYNKYSSELILDDMELAATGMVNRITSAFNCTNISRRTKNAGRVTKHLQTHWQLSCGYSLDIPRSRKKIFVEASSVFRAGWEDEPDLFGRSATFDAKILPYTHAFVKEMNRLYPLALVDTKREIMIVGRGASLNASSMDDKFVFRPERWIEMEDHKEIREAESKISSDLTWTSWGHTSACIVYCSDCSPVQIEVLGYTTACYSLPTL